MSYWSVEVGAITAQSNEDNSCKSNQFLVWEAGAVANFELTLKFRLENNFGNSGIQFRSHIVSKQGGIGYQADILPKGALCDEFAKRGTLLAVNGQKTVIAPDGNRDNSSLGPLLYEFAMR